MVRLCAFVEREPERWQCSQCGAVIPAPTGTIRRQCITQEPSTICGPGCQLRRTLSWFVRDDGKCGCTEYASQMDAWGCDECFRRIEEIVEHLRGAAEKKGLPFIATAARILVARAIEAAKREQANGQKAEAETGAADVGRAL